METRDNKINMERGEEGLELGGFSKDYYSPSSINEILMACVNLQAVYFQIWPHDWTPQIILRVALKYNFFSNCKVSCDKLSSFFIVFQKRTFAGPQEESKVF